MVGKNPEMDDNRAAVGRYMADWAYKRQSVKAHAKCFILILPALSKASLRYLASAISWSLPEKREFLSGLSGSQYRQNRPRQKQGRASIRKSHFHGGAVPWMWPVAKAMSPPKAL